MFPWPTHAFHPLPSSYTQANPPTQFSIRILDCWLLASPGAPAVPLIGKRGTPTVVDLSDDRFCVKLQVIGNRLLCPCGAVIHIYIYIYIYNLRKADGFGTEVFCYSEFHRLADLQAEIYNCELGTLTLPITKLYVEFTSEVDGRPAPWTFPFSIFPMKKKETYFHTNIAQDVSISTI